MAGRPVFFFLARSFLGAAFCQCSESGWQRVLSIGSPRCHSQPNSNKKQNDATNRRPRTKSSAVWSRALNELRGITRAAALNSIGGRHLETLRNFPGALLLPFSQKNVKKSKSGHRLAATRSAISEQAGNPQRAENKTKPREPAHGDSTTI